MHIGDLLPRLRLTTPTGGSFSLEQHRGDRPTVVLVVCNHCPFVKHVAPTLGDLGREWSTLGVVAVAINPNVATHPGDAPERMGPFADGAGWSFPYVVDADQSATTALGAAVTPDAFVFDGAGTLVYHGRIDSSTPGNGLRSDGADLRAAVRAVAAGDVPAQDQVQTLGCGVKWIGAEELPDA
ncbi:MAG: thioredoxin family protein [Solirubrobacteraceae bacterium]